MADTDGNSDLFGTALFDHYMGTRSEPLYQCDGPQRQTHPIEAFYFEPFASESDRGSWLCQQISGPLFDIGAGVGRHALYFQSQYETTAIDPSSKLVETMTDRGVSDARIGGLFGLTGQFDTEQFQSAIVIGTQLGLVRSMAGLTAFLSGLATITEENATAVVDSYDPTDHRTSELLGYRSDAEHGLASRAFWFEYTDKSDPVLLFRLFSPDRIREAAAGTPWMVAAIQRSAESAYYRIALEKSE